METKTIIKTILILLIGIALGVLVGGRFTMHKIHRANKIGTEQGFLEHALRVLDVSEAKKDSIMPILSAFAKENHLRHEGMKSLQKQAFDELRQDLSHHLSDDELKKMKRILRSKGPKKHKRKNKH